ncbi:MAG: sigma-54 dependent transcriptional regulator [Acidobacteriota bacterium]
MTRVLLVEDDPDLAFAVGSHLATMGHEVLHADSGRSALEQAGTTLADLVLLDLGLPDLDGFEVLERLMVLDPSQQVVVLTGLDEAESAVRALRLGASDYLTKPVSNEILCHAVEQAGERGSLRRRLESLDRAAGETGPVVGDSPVFSATLDALRAAAGAPRTPVLLTGETGSGKELAAGLLHRWSDRAQGPMISVNAAAFPASLLESELFGHEAGAFTSARSVRRGLFELADGGCLFLDEVGELPLALQPKLLRILEGHPFRRLGGEREVRSDFRLISATHRDLVTEVREGRFREDLYHRLRILEISLPPLRERAEDIPLLGAYFVQRFARELGRGEVELTPEALTCLRNYSWPGNVRELRNVLERAIVLTAGATIGPASFPPEVAGRGAMETPVDRDRAAIPALQSDRLEEVIRSHARRVFEQCDRNVTQAAERLGVARGTLRRHLQKGGLTGQKLTGTD